MIDKDIRLTQAEVDKLLADLHESEEKEIQEEKPKSEPEVKRLPTHDELREQGVDVPDWVPVEDIVWGVQAEAEYNNMIRELAEYCIRKFKEKQRAKNA